MLGGGGSLRCTYDVYQKIYYKNNNNYLSIEVSDRKAEEKDIKWGEIEWRVSGGMEKCRVAER